MVHTEVFVHHSQDFVVAASRFGFVSGTPWRPSALAPTIVSGAVAPRPSAQASSTQTMGDIVCWDKQFSSKVD
jgi:hypothetical protein